MSILYHSSLAVPTPLHVALHVKGRAPPDWYGSEMSVVLSSQVSYYTLIPQDEVLTVQNMYRLLKHSVGCT